MTRVHFDSLETNDGLYHLYEGKPFSGIGFDHWPNGQLKKSGEYDGSRPMGIMRFWDEGGNLTVEYLADHFETLHHYQKDFNVEGTIIRLKTEKRIDFDASCYTEKLFHDNGALKQETEYEFGFLVRQAEWSKYGTLLRQYFLIEGDKNYPSYRKKLDEYEEWKKLNMKG